MTIPLVTLEEVRNIINNLKTKKAFTYDLVNRELLKKLPTIAMFKLINFFNFIVCLERVSRKLQKL